MAQLKLLDASFKRFFYDREQVKAKLGKKRLRSLRKAGLSLRLASRRRLRRRKRASRPGVESPSVHSEDSFATLKNIQAGFDTFREASVVGSIGFPTKGQPPAPGVLEKGAHVDPTNKRRTLRKLGGAGEIEAKPVGGKQRDKSSGKLLSRVTKKEAATTPGRMVEGIGGQMWKVRFARLTTPDQVRRANELNELMYGPLEFPSEIYARPYMEPAVEQLVAEGKFTDLYLKESGGV